MNSVRIRSSKAGHCYALLGPFGFCFAMLIGCKTATLTRSPVQFESATDIALDQTCAAPTDNECVLDGPAYADSDASDAVDDPDDATLASFDAKTCSMSLWTALGFSVPIGAPDICANSDNAELGLACNVPATLGYWSNSAAECADVGVLDLGCACNPQPSGQLLCLRDNCGDPKCSCPKDFDCVENYWQERFCLDTAARQGTPCTTTCGVGHTNLKCIQIGNAGHFCYKPTWPGAGDCAPGFHEESQAAATYCLPEDPTATACKSAYAKQAQLATPCTMTDGTSGMRHCGPNGLTECAP